MPSRREDAWWWESSGFWYPEPEPWNDALWNYDLRYSTDDGSGKILAVPDQRGNLNELAASAAANRPNRNTVLIPGVAVGDWGSVSSNTLNLRSITAGPAYVLNGETPCTICVRCRPDAGAPAANRNLFGLFRDAATTAHYRFYRTGPANLMTVQRGNSSGQTVIDDDTPVAGGSFLTCFLTYDGDTLRQYRDTTLVASGDSQWDMLELRTWVLGNNYGNTLGWTGQIGNCLGWARVISPAEMEAQVRRDAAIWT
jgi:hypothetical protein